MIRFRQEQPMGDATVLGFTNEPQGRFLIAYAGPCPEKDCLTAHRRLYLIPMIGWFHMEDEDRNMILRPAVMIGNGVTVDYLDLPEEFLFIAVLEDDEDTIDKAKEIYAQRYNYAPKIEIDAVETLITN